MKKYLPLIMSATLLISGCTTTTSTGQKIPDAATIAAIAQSAASTGSILWLKSHPWDKPKFELARKALNGLIAAGNGSPAELQAALSSLPLSQLDGENGSVIVANAVTILNLTRNKLIVLDKNEVWSGYVLPVAQGLKAGLDQALGPEARRRKNDAFAFVHAHEGLYVCSSSTRSTDDAKRFID